LLKIANNILQNPEEKYRKLKSTNKMLKEKVLDARGGHEYLIAVSVHPPVSRHRLLDRFDCYRP
jgi:hypothetical protein